MSKLDELRNYLKNLSVWKPDEISKIEGMLAECWHELSGNTAGGMEGYKLRNRMEAVSWNPPLLSFNIVRHEAAVQGSLRGEIQAWTVNIETGSADCQASVGYRQLEPKKKPLQVEPIAKSIAEAILQGRKDKCLKWKNENEVRVLIGVVIPTNGPKQTVAGRRKRFWKALKKELACSNWNGPTKAQYFVRKVGSPSESVR